MAANNNRECISLRNELLRAREEIRALKRSESYRIGMAITWPVRGFVNACRDVWRNRPREITVANAIGIRDTMATVMISARYKGVAKVSVIIPMYNAAEYLGECLKSVCAQTLRELEIICVDDGSADDSVRIVRRYAKKDGRIVLIRQKNLFAGIARNAGLTVARGKYVHFLDSDDWIDGHTYERLYAIAEKCGCDFLKFRSFTYDNQTGSLKKSYFTDMGGVPAALYERPIRFIDHYKDLVKCSDAPWSGFYRRDFLEKSTVRFDNLRCANDVSFFYRCMLNAKSLYITSERFVYYRVNNSKSLIGIRPRNFDCQLRQYWIISSLLHHMPHDVAMTIRAHLVEAILFRYKGYVDDVRLDSEIRRKIERETHDFLAAIPASLVPDAYGDVYAKIAKNRFSPTVSVVVPVYNAEPYLDACLKSVCGQTLENIEIICVNDASTDSSADIIRRYAAADKRIRLIEKPCNTGAPGICKNIGIDNARGKYVGVVDSDDYISSDYFECLYEAAERSNAELAVTTGLVIDRDGVLFPLQSDRKLPALIGSTEEKSILASRSGSNCNKLYLLKTLRENAIRCHEVRNIAEDNLFTIESICAATSIAVIDGAKYYYRKHANSVTAERRSEKDFGIFDVYFAIEQFVNHRYKSARERQRHLAIVRAREKMDFSWFRRDCRYASIRAFESELKRRFPSVAREMGENPYAKLDKSVIVSLTSWPGRINAVSQVIQSILRQDAPIDRIILWLAIEQFPNREEDVPRSLIGLQNGVFEIRWCNDIRSYKKLIPTLKEFGDAIIITVDDDNVYAKDCIGKLLVEHFLHPQDVLCHRVTRIIPHVDGGFRTLAGGKSYYSGASCLNKLVGLGGVLYPPKCFSPEITDMALARELAPTNDDLWFWVHAVLAGHYVRVVANPNIEAHYVEGTQECGLSMVNDHGENLFWKDFNRLIGHYPDFRDRLLKEWAARGREQNDNMKAYRSQLENWALAFRQLDPKLDCPRTFNEKTQWMKLFASTPDKTRLADKYEVRAWVEARIGSRYLIPLIGVYDRFEDIDFDSLPDRFVLKCNHGCAFNIIVKDKANFDKSAAQEKIHKWMEINYGRLTGLELHYRDIRPRIIVEKYIENERSGGDLFDYKIWCFNGRAKYVQFLSERNISGLKMAFYDLNWEKQPFVYDHPLDTKVISRPDNLEEMTALAEKLAAGFPFVRVDFYRLDDGTILFGEMTFTSANGAGRWNDEYVNRMLGSLIKLPRRAYNIDSGLYFKKWKSKGRVFRFNPFGWIAAQRASRAMIAPFLKILSSWRVDVKFKKPGADFRIEDSSAGVKVVSPKWMNDSTSAGVVVSGVGICRGTFSLVGRGSVDLQLRGIDFHKDGKRFPIWAEYESIRVDGRSLLARPCSTWHDKPYVIHLDFHEQDTHRVEIRLRRHRYTQKELEQVMRGMRLRASADRVLSMRQVSAYRGQPSDAASSGPVRFVVLKIWGGFECFMDNGLKYTIRHAIGKVIRKFGGGCKW